MVTGAERTKHDVVIVGAGPAGSSAAIRLAQSGLKVLLVEQKKFPRAKLCGEFISPECLNHFAELNVLGKISTVGVSLDRTLFYARNGRSVTVPSAWFQANSSAIGLSRAEMDRQLLIRAREAGADVLEETQAVNLLFDMERICGVRLRGKARTMFDAYSALTIDATGRGRVLTRQIEKANYNSKRHRADFVAFKTHLEDAKVFDGDCEIYSYRGGYGGSIRVESGLHNLCFIISSRIARKFGSDPKQLLTHVVFENKRARSILSDARAGEEWLAVPIQNYGRAELSPAKGLLTIGDAAVFIDPFTGSGILLALESAKIAAEVIVDEFLRPESNRSFETITQKYRERHALAFNRRLRISSLVRRAAFAPRLAETFIEALSLNQSLTRRLAKATR